MKKINVGLVGFGLSGRYLQAPFFEASADFHLKTVVTSQPDLQASYPEAGQAGALQEVLSDKTIDLVSVASPNETHAEYARQCLLAGKHVLVEKPFAATAAEAEELVALAQKQGKHLFVFQNRRFDSDFMTVRNLIKSGRLGELLRFEAHYNRFKPILNPKKWKETPAPTSGILYDLGPHLIDQCVALFGEPSNVWGETYTQRAGSAIGDAFDLWLDYGHLKVYLTASMMVREPAPRYVLHGTAGSFVKFGIDVQEDHLKAGLLPGTAGFGVEPAGFTGVLRSERDGGTIEEEIETLPGNWQGLFQNMADVLLRGAEPVIRMEEVLGQLRVIGQVRRVVGL